MDQFRHPHRRWVLDERPVDTGFVVERGLPERLVGEAHHMAVPVAARDQQRLIGGAQHALDHHPVVEFADQARGAGSKIRIRSGHQQGSLPSTDCVQVWWASW